MSAPRIALVAAGGALVAAWLAAATTVPAGDVAVSAPPPAATVAGEGTQPAVAEELAADMERLRRRQERTPALRMSARNPFSLAAPPPPPRPGTLDPSARPRAPVASRRPPASRLAVELIGIAMEDTEAGSGGTGILTTPGGDVMLVRAGDRVPGGYRVDAVGPSSVTLVDGGGARHRLALP